MSTHLRGSEGRALAGQMVESLGGPPGGQDILVLLFTTANCLGRLACGWASEVLLHGYGTPRWPLLSAPGPEWCLRFQMCT